MDTDAAMTDAARNQQQSQAESMNKTISETDEAKDTTTIASIINNTSENAATNEDTTTTSDANNRKTISEEYDSLDPVSQTLMGLRPLVHVVVLNASDEKIHKYADDVQERFLNENCNVFLQTQTNPPASAAAGASDTTNPTDFAVDFASSSSATSNSVNPENLLGISTNSVADYFVVIGDRNVGDNTVHIKRDGKLVEVKVDELLAIIKEWNEKNLNGPLNQEPNQLTTDKIHGLIELLSGNQNIRARINQLEEAAKNVREQDTDNNAQPTTGEQTAKLTSAHNDAIQLHKALREATARITKLATSKRGVLLTQSENKEVGLPAELKKKLVSECEALLKKIETIGSSLPETANASLWGAYHQEIHKPKQKAKGKKNNPEPKKKRKTAHTESEEDQEGEKDPEPDVGDTPLHLACKNLDEDTVRSLVAESDKDPSILVARNLNGRLPAHMIPFATASEEARFNIIKLMVDKNPNLIMEKVKPLSAGTNTNEIALVHIACLHHDLRLLKYFAEKMPECLSLLDNQKSTALHFAVQQAGPGAEEVVDFLLDNKADVNAQDSLGRTPLMLSIKNNLLSVSKRLLDLVKQTANAVGIADKNQRTVLHYIAEATTPAPEIETQAPTSKRKKPATFNTKKSKSKKGKAKTAAPEVNPDEAERLSMAQTIIDTNNALLNKTDSEGNTPLLLAIKAGEIKMASKLLTRDNVNTANNNGALPLIEALKLYNPNRSHASTAKDLTSFINVLIDNGANVEAIDEQDEDKPTALIVACGVLAPLDIIKRLTTKNTINRTTARTQVAPLHLAAEEGAADISKYLLDEGADIWIEDNTHSIPLVYSVGQGFTNISDYIIDDIVGGEDNLLDHFLKEPSSQLSYQLDALLLEFTRQNSHTELLHSLLRKRIDRYLEAKASGRPHEQLQPVYKDHQDNGKALIHIICQEGYLDLFKMYIEWYELLELGGEPVKTETSSAAATSSDSAAEQGAPAPMEVDGDKKESNNKPEEKTSETNKPEASNGKNTSDITTPRKTRRTIKEEVARATRSAQKAKEIKDDSPLPKLKIVHELDDHNATPLHYAAMPYESNPKCTEYDKEQILLTLIRRGAQVDAQDEEGNTPLHVACRYGHRMLIQALCANGADGTKTNKQGQTPERLAASFGHYVGQFFQSAKYKPEVSTTKKRKRTATPKKDTSTTPSATTPKKKTPAKPMKVVESHEEDEDDESLEEESGDDEDYRHSEYDDSEHEVDGGTATRRETRQQTKGKKPSTKKEAPARRSSRAAAKKKAPIIDASSSESDLSEEEKTPRKAAPKKKKEPLTKEEEEEETTKKSKKTKQEDKDSEEAENKEDNAKKDENNNNNEVKKKDKQEDETDEKKGSQDNKEEAKKTPTKKTKKKAEAAAETSEPKEKPKKQPTTKTKETTTPSKKDKKKADDVKEEADQQKQQQQKPQIQQPIQFHTVDFPMVPSPSSRTSPQQQQQQQQQPFLSNLPHATTTTTATTAFPTSTSTMSLSNTPSIQGSSPSSILHTLQQQQLQPLTTTNNNILPQFPLSPLNNQNRLPFPQQQQPQQHHQPQPQQYPPQQLQPPMSMWQQQSPPPLQNFQQQQQQQQSQHQQRFIIPQLHQQQLPQLSSFHPQQQQPQPQPLRQQLDAFSAGFASQQQQAFNQQQRQPSQQQQPTMSLDPFKLLSQYQQYQQMQPQPQQPMSSPHHHLLFHQQQQPQSQPFPQLWNPHHSPGGSSSSGSQRM